MRQFDLTPLYRSTVGFDRLFSALDQFASAETAPSYPPYDIERTGENAYRITVAVAGFTEEDLSIEVRENALTLRGERKAEAEKRAVTPPAGSENGVASGVPPAGAAPRSIVAAPAAPADASSAQSAPDQASVLMAPLRVGIASPPLLAEQLAQRRAATVIAS